MKFWIYIICLVYTYAGNSTDCVSMYKSGNITVPCVDANACCFLNYTYADSIQTKCYLKKELNDSICNTIPDAIGFYGAQTLECDCDMFYIKYAFINLILLMVFI